MQKSIYTFSSPGKLSLVVQFWMTGYDWLNSSGRYFRRVLCQWAIKWAVFKHCCQVVLQVLNAVCVLHTVVVSSWEGVEGVGLLLFIQIVRPNLWLGCAEESAAFFFEVIFSDLNGSIKNGETFRSFVNRCKFCLQGQWDGFQIVIQAFNTVQNANKHHRYALRNINRWISHQYFSDCSGKPPQMKMQWL